MPHAPVAEIRGTLPVPASVACNENSAPTRSCARFLQGVIPTLFVLLLAGCAGGLAAGEQSTSITVAGRATVRGHEPFTAVVLETNQHNLYVLVLDEARWKATRAALPIRLRVTGVPYVGWWNNQRLAHIRPTAIERP